MLDLLEEYKDRFAKRVGRTDIVSHEIRLKEGVPYTRRMYAIPDSLQNGIDRQMVELLEQGMIEESDSPYAAPIVCVKKRNGEIRLACDYRSINLKAVDNAYGMADLTELIERAAKAKYVSTIDLASAYWQVPMSPESKLWTSFRTRRGLFQWNVMPQGLKNISKTFQALMNKVLLGAGVYANPHQDDIIITSYCFEEHLSHIRDILEMLRLANLTVRASKTQFAREETKCLEFVVGNGKIAPDLVKVKAIENLPVCTSKKSVLAFLGSRVITVDTLKIIVSEHFLSLNS